MPQSPIMKHLTLLTLPLLVAAAPAPLDKRQMTGMTGKMGGAGAAFSILTGLWQVPAGNPQVPLSTKALVADIDTKAKRELLLWGPFILPAKNATHGRGVGIKLDPNSDAFGAKLSGLCKDCTVLFAEADIANKDGSRADVGTGIYTHHIIMVDYGRKMIDNPVLPHCGTTGATGISPTTAQWLQNNLMPKASVFIGGGGSGGSGGQFAVKGSDVKSGFHIAEKDSMLFTTELVNYDNWDKEIYLRLDYEYLTGKPQGYLDVGIGAIDVDGCTASLEFHPPSDRAITIKSPVWEVIADGYLVRITPHLHDGGVDAKIFLNGEHVCTSNAIYGTSEGTREIDGKKWETISGYTPCSNAIKIKKGDRLTMTSDYDLTKYTL
ncbi:hypothetical protein EJ06DRAFT_545987 [Trichodelitschia bisporula]|uniref:Galactose mutarotase-like protein n=1 Tax=Trichodelitschia bisporula TaxID=703511 RepID=A0A6G1IBH0_9PEZI|nr:hypothetical protein EJ06DRAFT_545987 [Trichodelitschia bisporula]